ncbi:hypothetical protein ACFX1Q_023075 [Malus domestica]
MKFVSPSSTTFPFRAATENGHNRHRRNCDRDRLGLGRVDPGVPDQHLGSAHPGAWMECTDAGLQAVAADVQGSMPQLRLRPRAADRFHAPVCRPLERGLVETDSHQALLQPVLPATVHRQNLIPATAGAMFDHPGKRSLTTL